MGQRWSTAGGITASRTNVRRAIRRREVQSQVAVSSDGNVWNRFRWRGVGK